MEIAQRTILSAGCHDAVMRFFSSLDAGHLDVVAAAFAEDGVWYRLGAALRGPQAVARALAERPAGRVTAHLVHNLVVDLDDEYNARVRFTVLTYVHDAGEGAIGVAPLTQAHMIATYDDRLRRSGEQWLVLERRGRPLFASR
jgi:ketosteroid isomerase-like protein